MIGTLFIAVLISGNPQVLSDPFSSASAEKLPYTGWSHIKTQVLAVANDGAYALATDGRYLQGYRLDSGYSLIPNYPDKVIFPGGQVSYQPSGRYYGLRGGLAINVLSSSAGATKYAVFSIDPAVDPAPTDILQLGPSARLVDAELGGRTIRLTVAESVQSQIIQFVDYSFELTSRTTSGVRVAKRLSRKPTSFSVRMIPSESGTPGGTFGGGGGSVSADGERAIFYHDVVSLRSNKVTSFDPGTGASMFFVGEDLYASREAPAAGATQENNYDAGIYGFRNGKWQRVSRDILQAISPNGRFAMVKRLPKEVGGKTEWLIVRLRSPSA